MPQLDTASKRRARELILQVLRAQTTTVDATGLRYALADLGQGMDPADYQQHLLYLAGKGYLRILGRTLGSFTTQLLELTAMGQDLLDGTISDPGVGQPSP